MSDSPRGLHREFTDAQLREALEEGVPVREIAARFDVTPQAVYKRIGRLEDCTTAAAVAPEESRRYVQAQIHAMEELSRCLRRTNLLSDACDRWLREIGPDGEPMERYDVGPRANEVQVTYWKLREDGERIGKRPERKDLQSLLDVALDPEHTELVGAESRHADPRELVLKTSTECRAILSTCAELARTLTDARRMQRLQELIFAALQRVEPRVAAEIAEELRRDLVLHGAFRGPDALPFGDG